MLNKFLRLTRPLVVFDLETTGLDPKKDRICQMGITMHYVNRDPIKWCSLIDPEIPILNSGKHHITDADIQACTKCHRTYDQHEENPTICEKFTAVPKFREVAPVLAPKITNVDLCGYNPANFDVLFMKAEMQRAEVAWPWEGYIIDPLQIYRMRRGHTLVNCYLEFGGPGGWPLPPDTKVDEAHDAGFDVYMTEVSLRGQLLRFPDLPRTVAELSAFCFPHPENSVDSAGRFVWVNGKAAFNFGKWRGKFLQDPQVRHYLRWMVNDGEFSDEVKGICEDVLNGNPPIKK